jgi:hypothetical protein
MQRFNMAFFPTLHCERWLLSERGDGQPRAKVHCFLFVFARKETDARDQPVIPAIRNARRPSAGESL